MSWWELPGPTSFARSIARDLRRGQSVIVAVPKHMPSGLMSEVTRHVEGTLQIRSIAVEDGSPVEQLYRVCVYEPIESGLRNAASLACEPSFSGQVIWVDEMDVSRWKQWREFLTDYEHAARTVGSCESSVFCILLTGETALVTPHEDIRLSIHRWNGCVTELDMLLYAGELCNIRRGQIERQLRIHIIASLSMWDAELCEFLSTLSLDQIITPANQLQAFNLSRGWEAMPEDTQQQWANGCAAFFEGRIRLHSAFIKDDLAELNRRVWRAQLSILLPYVEEERQKIVAEFGHILTNAWGSGTEDPYDLEIGDISYRLHNQRGVDRAQLWRVRRLAQIRNNLAHLKVVSPAMLQIFAAPATV